jgi:hypothetical protein
MSDELLCERCLEAGIEKPADVVYDTRRVRGRSSKAVLFDSLPRSVIGRQFLCYEHFEILPEAFFSEYVPVEVGVTLELVPALPG